MSSTTVYGFCMTCDTKTPSERDNEGGGLARKQVSLWQQANGWRGLPSVVGRRRSPVSLCAACVADIVALTKAPPTLEEQS